jgi:hypothetical protein
MLPLSLEAQHAITKIDDVNFVSATVHPRSFLHRHRYASHGMPKAEATPKGRLNI